MGQSTELKVIVSSKEEPMHVLGCLGLSGITTMTFCLWAGVLIAPSQRVQHSIGHEPCVKSLRPNWSCCTVHCSCSFNLETHWLAMDKFELTRYSKRHLIDSLRVSICHSVFPISRIFFHDHSSILNSVCLVIDRKVNSLLHVFFRLR